MQRHREYPHKDQHMVSGSDYYRARADVDRGLKKKDFPSIEQADPSQKAQDEAVAAEKTPAKSKDLSSKTAKSKAGKPKSAKH